MRFLFLVFCVLLSTSCAVQASLSTPPSPGAGCIRSSVNGTRDESNSFPSVVRVYSEIGACSGTQVAPHIVVTAQHCVSRRLDNSASCTTLGPTGDTLDKPVAPSTITIIGDVTRTTGKVLFVPEQHNVCGSDFAVIVTNEQAASKSSAVRLSEDSLPGEGALIVGYGLSPTSSFGIRHYRSTQVLGVGSGVAAPNEIYTGIGAFPGDSGGALFSAKTGALIGVTSKLWFVGEFDFNNPTGLSIFTQSQQMTAAIFAAMHETGEIVQEEVAGECL